jgi:hypothetical protein
MSQLITTDTGGSYQALRYEITNEATPNADRLLAGESDGSLAAVIWQEPGEGPRKFVVTVQDVNDVLRFKDDTNQYISHEIANGLTTYTVRLPACTIPVAGGWLTLCDSNLKPLTRFVVRRSIWSLQGLEIPS